MQRDRLISRSGESRSRVVTWFRIINQWRYSFKEKNDFRSKSTFLPFFVSTMIRFFFGLLC